MDRSTIDNIVNTKGYAFLSQAQKAVYNTPIVSTKAAETSPIGLASTPQAVNILNSAKATETRLAPPTTSTIAPKAEIAPSTATLASKIEPQKTTGQYTFDEAFQLVGKDFTGVKQMDDGKYALDDSALKRIGIIKSPQTQQQTQLEADTATATADVSNLRNFTSEMANDPALTGLLNSIAGQWDSRIEEMKKSVASQTAAIETTGVRLGGRYTGGAGGIMGSIISAQERAGMDKVTGLIADKNNALAEARSAYETKKWNRYVDLVNLSEKKLAESKKAIADLNKTVIEENKKIKEVKEKQTEVNRLLGVEALVSDSIFSGTTDANSIFRAIVSSGIKTTTKEVADAIKNIEVTEKVAPGEIGQWLGLKENDSTKANMTFEEYLNLKDPSRALDVREQVLRIAKIEKELKEAKNGADPFDVLAYAQQYMATGQIPIGLKGAGVDFGMVSRVAKSIPQQSGVIVNTVTGVRDVKTSSAQQDDFAALYDITQKTKRLKKLDEERMQGLISAGLGKIFGADKQGEYLTLRKSIVDDIARMQTGAALTEDEQVFYEDYLPGRVGEVLGVLGRDTQSKIGDFETVMNERLRNRSAVNNLSIYGYTKIKIGDTEYTVGDTIKNSKGQQGRVLPDGSIYVEE